MSLLTVSTHWHKRKPRAGYRGLIMLLLTGLIALSSPITAVAALVEEVKAEAADIDQRLTQLPTASRINNMPVYAQQRTLSCEYSAARAIASTA